MNQIREFTGDYRWLSNFWMVPIVYGPWTWPSAEHLYQAAKSIDPQDWKDVYECVSPGAAKRMGRHITMRPDWNDIKLGIMREVIEAKFDQHPDLREKLLATKGLVLTEGNTWGDTFWGVCRGVGQNHLGRILMEYRDAKIS